MPRARRAAHLFFRLSEDLLPDVESLLRGEVSLTSQTRLLAVSILTGRERVVSHDEARSLWSLPTDGWTPVEELAIDADALEQFARDGLVIVDADSGELSELRARDERLKQSDWDPYAALYQSKSAWRDVDISRIGLQPPPTKPSPPPFYASPQALSAVELPLPRREGELFRLLLERKTTRSFAPEQALTRDQLSVLLYYTFGWHAFARIADELVVVRKTSPSGGSLHPIEVYPLVIDVDSLEAGLYHYRADRHALDLLERLDSSSARERALVYTAGQSYLSSMKVLLILTARFSRSFWKYRSSARALAVILMDAAHLSQTLYLVCAELGLGAFVSAAVNSGNIEDDLRLDAFEQGVLAVCGCGPPAVEHSPVDAQFEPYVPRTTRL
jgi:putative peptide maturation dehydrogenase